MASVPLHRPRSNNPIVSLGIHVTGALAALGDLVLFSLHALAVVAVTWPSRRVLWPTLYRIGFESAPVVWITGSFIGMVLALQSYDTLHLMHFENRIGSVINASLIKELGPTLAATMLAGRIGSAIATEIGTMKVTEQIDALRALGAEPVAYLVAPRFLACFGLIPALTLTADAMGMFGGWFLSTQVFRVESHFYWYYSKQFLSAFDVWAGIIKSLFFGGAIALIACHRGFACSGGAEGVGRAATESFVLSFIAILGLDFILGAILLTVQKMIG